MRLNLRLVYASLTSILILGCGQARTVTAPVEPIPAPDVVALIDGEPLTLAAFEKEYVRTSGDREAASRDSVDAYADFLDRYVDYRVKVRRARELGLDRDARILEEVDNYRKQLARPYLLEREVTEPLLRDLYEKKQQAVEASHILIRLGKDASPVDTLDAFNRISALRDSVLAGHDFGDLAVKYSEDPSAKGDGLGARGYLGYFSGGKMVKAFEDWAFKTPVGEVSPVFRSPYGYHLIQVKNRIPMPADVRLSHIMVRPRGHSHADTLDALARLDSVRQHLAAGEDFAALAETWSDDPSSSKKGGDLGYISFDARLIPVLKDAAFALKEIGDVSEPVLSPYGYHLIQLTGRRPIAGFEESVEALKKDLGRLPRVKQAEEAFAKSLLVKNGLRVDTMQVMALFEGYSADSLQKSISSITFPDSVESRPFARLGSLDYTVGDFLSFARSHRVARMNTVEEQVLEMMDRFFQDVAIDAEVEHLEARDASFRETMEEFRNGLLLFRLMEDSVWTAASQDTSALQAYFEAHAADYRFPDRTRLIGLYSNSDSLLNAFGDGLDQGIAFEVLVERARQDSLHTFRYDTTLVAGETNSVFDKGLDLEPGGHTGALPYTRGFILLIHDGIEPARNKRFEEARAEVLNAYQNVLEDRLLTRLRRKYHVRTFPDRLVNAFKEQPAGTPDSTR